MPKETNKQTNRWVASSRPFPDPDQTPVEIPADYRKVETMEQIIGRVMAQRLSELTQEKDFDSWEESQDFEDVDPDLLDMTAYEFDELDGEVIVDPDAEIEPLTPSSLPNQTEHPTEEVSDRPSGSNGDDPLPPVSG